MTARRRATPQVLFIGIMGLLAVGSVGFISGQDHESGDVELTLLTAVAFGTLGPWVWLRASGDLGGRLAAVGAAAALNWCAQGWSMHVFASWVAEWSWLLPVLLIPLTLTRFPDGARPDGWRRWAEVSLTVSTSVAVAVLAVAALGAPHDLLTAPASSKPAWAGHLLVVVIGACVIWLVAAVLLVACLTRSGLHSAGKLRAQMLTIGAAVLVLLFATAGVILWDTRPFQIVTAVALPLGVTFSVLRFALYDLDLLVHRLAVWLTLTLVVASVVAVVVVLAGRRFLGAWAAPVQIAVLVALVFTLGLAEKHIQTAVGRLLYGYGRMPEQALGVLGRQLGTATAAGSAEALCRSVAETLAVPWVGFRGVTGPLLGAWGRTTSTPMEVSLGLGSQTVGMLLLCPRRVGENFTAHERSLIEQMSTQIAVAVQALVLARALQDSRERVIRSRENERKRLRDDLHDGLGPALVGLRMQLRAARAHVGDPTIDQQLMVIEADLGVSVSEVARVIDGLRPAALDDGLTAALRGEARRLSGPTASVELDAASNVESTPLPPAVETAAYRIACEAMSNAVKHSNGQLVLISLRCRGGTGLGQVLEVQVDDSGLGVLVPRPGGVGLESMRERAEEVGGSLRLEAHPGVGTTVTACLPLHPSGT